MVAGSNPAGPTTPATGMGIRQNSAIVKFMRNFKVVWIALIATAFAANAYAAAFAASCDCVNTIPAETVKVDMQCHDADVPDPASGVDIAHTVTVRFLPRLLCSIAQEWIWPPKTGGTAFPPKCQKPLFPTA